MRVFNCNCIATEHDPNCPQGIYLMKKVLGVQSVISTHGFLELSPVARDVVHMELRGWHEYYTSHVTTEREARELAGVQHG